MDSHLEDAYESSQGADIDDPADGFEWWDRDETDDGEEEPDDTWPCQEDPADFYRRQTEPDQTDEERKRIDEEWRRWGDDWPAIN